MSSITHISSAHTLHIHPVKTSFHITNFTALHLF